MADDQWCICAGQTCDFCRWSFLLVSDASPANVQDSFEVVNESMDIVVTLLDRFGGVITAKGLQAQLQPALLPLLDDSRTALFKRTIICLCAWLYSWLFHARKYDACLGAELALRLSVLDIYLHLPTMCAVISAQRRWRCT